MLGLLMSTDPVLVLVIAKGPNYLPWGATSIMVRCDMEQSSSTIQSRPCPACILKIALPTQAPDDMNADVTTGRRLDKRKCFFGGLVYIVEPDVQHTLFTTEIR